MDISYVPSSSSSSSLPLLPSPTQEEEEEDSVVGCGGVPVLSRWLGAHFSMVWDSSPKSDN